MEGGRVQAKFKDLAGKQWSCGFAALQKSCRGWGRAILEDNSGLCAWMSVDVECIQHCWQWQLVPMCQADVSMRTNNITDYISIPGYSSLANALCFVCNNLLQSVLIALLLVTRINVLRGSLMSALL